MEHAPRFHNHDTRYLKRTDTGYIAADWFSDPRKAFDKAGAGGVVRFSPNETYAFAGAPTLADGMTIQGGGRHSTILSHDFDGNFAEVPHGVKIADLTIDGNGATQTGGGLTFPNGEGEQALVDVSIIDFDDPCLDFALSGGSLFRATRVEAYRINALTTTGRYAVVIEDAEQVAAVPRSFVQFDTGGSCAFSFGGSNNTYIEASTLGDLAYSAESRAVEINGGRILNQVALAFNGHGNTIVGVDVHPTITIASGAQGNVIGPNAYNNFPVNDNSGNATNLVYHYAYAYTPELTSGGTAPSLGNGTLTGEYERHGAAITAVIEFTVGSTTTLGTGDLRFSLPTGRSNSSVIYPGIGIVNQAGTLTFAQAVVGGALGYVSLVQPGVAGSVTSASPGAFAAGDTVRITVTYPL